jgi:hypothetical protein
VQLTLKKVKRVKTMAQIIFKTTQMFHDGIQHPYPAYKNPPAWYKKMSVQIEPISVREDNEVVSFRTIKSCIPVRDLLFSGYIIPLWGELASQKMDQDSPRTFSFVDSGMEETHVSRHFANQFMGSPLEKETRSFPMPKLGCPWSFHTDPGYSTLFIEPQYRENKISILPAIVDTDRWHSVLFPFKFNEKFSGKITSTEIIPEGTPLIQAIPFKREDFKMHVEIRKPEEKQNWLHQLQKKINDSYLKNFHTRKNYR